MKTTIKNRWTQKTQIQTETESLKTACEKNKANLREADLRGANLCGANLCGADLRGVKINNSQKESIIKSLNLVII